MDMGIKKPVTGCVIITATPVVLPALCYSGLMPRTHVRIPWGSTQSTPTPTGAFPILGSMPRSVSLFPTTHPGLLTPVWVHRQRLTRLSLKEPVTVRTVLCPQGLQLSTVRTTCLWVTISTGPLRNELKGYGFGVTRTGARPGALYRVDVT
jgi:hypothetical protein